MAAPITEKRCAEQVSSCRVLVVGAGGIGCELLKNLVLTGFTNIEVIDLDTIDVSNLNRQFLFRKEHVGKSKAEVAKESALQFNPDAKITAYHDSIFSSDYGLNFFKQFTVVMNALDNRAARNHVNRMCLAADVPLIESGTAGYLGQVTVIKKGFTECYECQPKPAQKTFPGCTIRNTPSEPIHCIVWAKHLFNQLFGEDDPDQDVSPDTEDPEAAGDAGEAALSAAPSADAVGGIERRSTRQWAVESAYDVEKLFTKLFNSDIQYLLSMHNLWKNRRAPTPLEWNNLPDTGNGGAQIAGIHDQRIWTVKECVQIFGQSVTSLKEELQKQGDGGMLVWDKDDPSAMDFVTCAANIRAHIFGIPLKSRFDIKSMAGNIIPAIATTNAIIAGLIVIEGLKVLMGDFEHCRTVYLNRQPNPRKKLLVPCVLDKPNPKCYVCRENPEVAVKLNPTTITVRTLQDKILKSTLGMVAPDVEIDDGKGTILISSEEGETEDNLGKTLDTFGINNGMRLKCDDFLQVYNLNVNVVAVDQPEDDAEFEVIGDVSKLQEDAEKATTEQQAMAEATVGENGANRRVSEDDDLMLVDSPDASPPAAAAAVTVGKKRKLSEQEGAAPAVKKSKVMEAGDAVAEEDDDLVIL